MALKLVTEEFIDELKLGLSPEAVLAVPDNYLSEPRSRWRGISSVLLLPRNVNEVSTVVSLANARNIPIIGLIESLCDSRVASGISSREWLSLVGSISIN